MPTIPRIQPRETLKPLPGVRQNAALTPEAAGMGIAEQQQRSAAALGQDVAAIGNRVASTGLDLYSRELEQADQTRLLGAQNQWFNWKQAARKALSGALGTNAIEAGQKLQDEAGKQLDKIGEGLDPRQQERWQRVAQGELEQFQSELDGHVVAETHKAHVDELAAAGNNFINDAVANYDRPEVFKVRVAQAAATQGQLNATLGRGPEASKAATLKATTAAYDGAIKSSVAKNDLQTARAYLDAGKKTGQIDLETQTGLGALLDKEDRETEALNVALQVKDMRGSDGKPLSLAAREDAATELLKSKPDTLKAALPLIHERYNAEKETEARTYDANAVAMYQALNDGKGLVVVRKMPGYDKADGGLLRGLAQFAEEKAGGTGPDPRRAALAFYKILGERQADPVGFSQRQLGKDLPAVGLAYFNHLASLQMADRGNLAAPKEVAPFLTQQEVLGKIIEHAEIKKDSPEAANLYLEMNRRVNVWQADNSKKADSRQIEQIANGLLTDVVTSPGYVWDTKKKAADVTVEDIPATERSQVIAQINATPGFRATDDTIVDWWLRWKAKKASGQTTSMPRPAVVSTAPAHHAPPSPSTSHTTSTKPAFDPFTSPTPTPPVTPEAPKASHGTAKKRGAPSVHMPAVAGFPRPPVRASHDVGNIPGSED